MFHDLLCVHRPSLLASSRRSRPATLSTPPIPCLCVCFHPAQVYSDTFLLCCCADSSLSLPLFYDRDYFRRVGFHSRNRWFTSTLFASFLLRHLPLGQLGLDGVCLQRAHYYIRLWMLFGRQRHFRLPWSFLQEISLSVSCSQETLVTFCSYAQLVVANADLPFFI